MSTMAKQGEKKAFERLPTHVLPKNYALILTPNLKDFTFVGEEVVELEVRNNECMILWLSNVKQLFNSLGRLKF